MARYVIPQAYGISRQTFDELDNLIRAAREGSKQFGDVMNLAARLLAHTTQGYAMRYYRGAQYPSGRPGTIPVRQITGRSGRGWRVRRVAYGSWEVFNEERGAWMVEHGIVRGGGGVRRPVLRMSGVATLRFIQRTRFAERIMGETFGSLRDNKGRFRSFAARLQGSNLLAAPMVRYTPRATTRPRVPAEHRWAARGGLLRVRRS